MLEHTLSEFQKWDSANSLLLSGYTSNIAFDSQCQIRELLQAYSASDEVSLSDEVKQKLIEAIERLELALKADIGVFAVEFEDDRKFKAYGEIGREAAKKLGGNPLPRFRNLL